MTTISGAQRRLHDEAGYEVTEETAGAYTLWGLRARSPRLSKLFARRSEQLEVSDNHVLAPLAHMFKDVTDLRISVFETDCTLIHNLKCLHDHLFVLRKQPDWSFVRGWSTAGRHSITKRNAQVIVDHESVWLILDLDRIDARWLGLPYTAAEMANDAVALEAAVAEVLDEYTGGLLRDVSFVAAPTGSMGMKDGKYELRCRVFIQLSKPLSLANQKVVLCRLDAEVKDCLRSKGISVGRNELIDTRIAKPAQLVLTAQGHVVREDGRLERTPFGFPIIYIERERPQADVPDDWRTPPPRVRRGDTKTDTIIPAGGIDGDREIISNLARGHCQNVVEQQLLFRIACRHWNDEVGADAALGAIWDDLQVKLDAIQTQSHKPEREKLRSHSYCMDVIRRVWINHPTRPFDPDSPQCLSPVQIKKTSGRQLQQLDLTDELASYARQAKYGYCREVGSACSDQVNLDEARQKLKSIVTSHDEAAATYVPVENSATGILGSNAPLSTPIAARCDHIDATVGVGKTAEVVRSVTHDLKRLSKERVLWAAPIHTLAEQTVRDLREAVTQRASQLGVVVDAEALVRHHKGRDRSGMCPDREQDDGTYDKLGKEYEELGLSPMPVCEFCPHSSKCPWISQRDDNRPGIAVIAHAALYTTKPRTRPFVGDEGQMERHNELPDRVIIDESIANTAVGEPLKSNINALGPNACLPLIEMKQNIVVNGQLQPNKYEYLINPTLSQRFVNLRNQLRDALRQASASQTIQSSGAAWLSSADLKKVKIGVEDVESATRLELQHRTSLLRRVKGISNSLADTLSEAERKSLKRELVRLKRAMKAALIAEQLWSLLREHFNITDRTEVFGVRIKKENGATIVIAHQAKRLPEWFAYTPTLCLDGTADERIVAATMRCKGGRQPDIEFHRVEVKPSNYALTQIADSAYPTYRLIDERPRKRNVARAEMRKKVGRQKIERSLPRSDSRLGNIQRFIITLSARHAPEVVAVICPLDVRKRLERNRRSNVRYMHYNDLRGRNDVQDAAALVAVGRSTPSPDEQELMTEALFFDDASVKQIQRQVTGWPRGPVRLKMADRRAIEIEGERHPDPLVEAVRYQFVDAEIEQALGRVRLVRRGEMNKPCEVYYFGQVGTRLPVHRICNFVDVVPNLTDIMLEAGLAPYRGETAKQMFPDFVPADQKSRDAAVANAISNFESGKIYGLAPIYNYSYGANPYFLNAAVTSEWRLGGFRLLPNQFAAQPRPSIQKIPVCLDKHADPKAAIENALGLKIEWLGWQEDAPREITIEPLKLEYAGIVAQSP